MKLRSILLLRIWPRYEFSNLKGYKSKKLSLTSRWIAQCIEIILILCFKARAVIFYKS